MTCIEGWLGAGGKCLFESKGTGEDEVDEAEEVECVELFRSAFSSSSSPSSVSTSLRILDLSW